VPSRKLFIQTVLDAVAVLIDRRGALYASFAVAAIALAALGATALLRYLLLTSMTPRR
jgi:hypothetical protein